MASCAVFDGTESSFTCGEIQGITPPRPKKYYFSDRFPLQSGSLVNSDNINKTKNVTRPHSRSSYRSKKKNEDIFRRVDLDNSNNDEHLLRRKHRLNTVSEETGSSRRNDPSLDDSRPRNKVKQFEDENHIKGKIRTNTEVPSSPRRRDLESTKENLMRGQQRLIPGCDEIAGRPRRCREKEINDENNIHGKMRFNSGHGASKNIRNSRRDKDSDGDNYDRGSRQKMRSKREIRKTSRCSDQNTVEEHRTKDGRRRMNFDHQTNPIRTRDTNVKNDDKTPRVKGKTSYDKAGLSRLRDTEGVNDNEKYHRGRAPRIDSDSDDTFLPRSRLQELPSRKNRVASNIKRRDSDLGVNELPNRKNRVASDLMRRDSDLGDNKLPKRKNRVPSVIMRRDSDLSDHELPKRKNRVPSVMRRDSDLSDNKFPKRKNRVPGVIMRRDSDLSDHELPKRRKSDSKCNEKRF